MADLTVAEFQAANRAPVFKGMWNSWTLLRTGRDEPDDDDVRTTTAAVFAKWFGSSGAAAILDPSLTHYGTTRSGPADWIKVIKWGPASGAGALPLTATVKRSELSAAQKRAGVSLTRETAPGPLQMIVGGGAGPLRVVVHFVWRGEQDSVPWPVWRTNGFIQLRSWALDPLAQKDWCLERVHEPKSGAPAEQSSLGKLGDQVEDVILEGTNTIAEPLEATVSTIKAGAGLAIAAGGLWAAGKVYNAWRK